MGFYKKGQIIKKRDENNSCEIFLIFFIMDSNMTNQKIPPFQHTYRYRRQHAMVYNYLIIQTKRNLTNPKYIQRKKTRVNIILYCCLHRGYHKKKKKKKTVEFNNIPTPSVGKTNHNHMQS